MEAIGPVLIVVSVPLLLRWVPRNYIYGFRIAATLRDDAVWYDVNARSALHFILLGGLMIALEFVLPIALRRGILTAVAVAGLSIIVTINWRRANRLAARISG